MLSPIGTNPIESTTRIFKDRDSVSVLSDKRILVVDDEHAVVRTVVAHLRRGGFTEVQQETDSRQVIKAVREFKPDMVLLDILMPHISGLEILQQISANPEFDNIVVLMLSAAGQYEEEQSLERGAIGFVPKPATPEELIRIISTTFRITNRFGPR